ncbi:MULTISPECIES: hypothetical protein [unclassified Robiginitalea]|uniref:hypothetical protein n=1 Tax=Robiginitalea TaxID=252306 RepID=UPI0023499D91|nr:MULTISPECIES: hypothetical protein [unclassified Robiginitalea]MDC6353282.1 hypothetical protein [Robiginitalea sp. PM2]MDC6373552.1 hypothetical protein [Robiginitalea sp. SP8]
MKLLQHLMSLQTGTIKISELKGQFTPVELATHIGTLLDAGFIEVDWHRKMITVSGEMTEILKNRKSIASFKRETPEYMKTEKFPVNKPKN